ncbi:O-antigen ligase family protein [Sphingomonas natans]|uniref:O-antigen ligase family protein n=1 Tax=Sphingomonas natans TaxID=3063330 RepID=UPI0026E116E3|nr:O-antigen ligase family protein [Sphingomonas sp. BIUV-7]
MTALAMFLRPYRIWKFSWPVAGLAVAYVALSTVTAMRINTGVGLEKTAQFMVVVLSASFAVRHIFILNSDERFKLLKHFTILNIFVLAHVIAYHIFRGYFTTWKYLFDTKLVFSVGVVLLFMFEDRIRSFSSSVWYMTLLSYAVIVLASGERKAYLLLALIFLFSKASAKTVLAVTLMSIALATAFVSLSHGTYVARQLTSADRSLDAMPTRAFFSDASIAEHSDMSRAFTNRMADKLFAEHPVFGAGATGYQAWAIKTYGPLTRTNQLPMNVHGERHRIPAESGWIGVVVAVLLLIVAAIRVIRYLILNGGSSATSLSRSSAYLYLFSVCYCYSEAIDTTLLTTVVIFGFVCAGLDQPVFDGLLRRSRRRGPTPLLSAHKERARVGALRLDRSLRVKRHY